MRLFPEIKITRATDRLTLETGPSLIEHAPFILGIMIILPVWLFIIGSIVTGQPFPNGPFVPVTFSTGILVFAICGLLAAPISVRAVFHNSPERLEVTANSKLRVSTRIIYPRRGKLGFEIDYRQSRLAVLGPGSWNRAVYLTGPFRKRKDLAEAHLDVHDWLTKSAS
jgi:hypothetical protein